MEQIPETGSSISVRKWILVLGAFGVVYYIVMRIRLEILMWKEKSAKLATRRKYGIPDHDRRPFNVAYTAAILANEEREKEERKKTFLRQPGAKPVQEAQSLNHRESHADQTFNPATGEQTIRLMHCKLSLISNNLTPFADDSDRYGTSTSLVLPGAYSSTPNPISSPTKPSVPPFAAYPSNKPGYANSFRARKASGQLYFDQNGNSRHAARNIVDLSSEGDARKRGYGEQGLDEAELSKNPRVGGDQFIDGDEEPQWDDFETALSHQRGAKRVFGDEDSGAEGSRDKRARKVSLDKSGRMVYANEGMDVDDEMYDDVPDLLSPVRGKKRDRAEAGSTFGGDDSDSSQENEKHRQRRRKRRTVAKRKSDTGLLNGNKRDRDMDVDEEMGTPGRSRHHKKGKRHSIAHHRDGHNSDNSDVSIDDSLASSTRSRHRKVGEQWESNGIRYKITRNGQRLRQALVKRARNKFVMPQDSLHPDKDENLEVYVECWLTEEEYQDAKINMRLAWQDSPKGSAEPENLSVKIPQPKATPTRPVGKDLLWSSTVSTPNHSPATGSPLDGPVDFPILRPKGLRNPARYSLGSQTGLRNNPFEKQSSITTKRIASASYLNQAIHGGLSDSTNTRPRNLSKWERQEIEAEAITKLRAMKRAEDDAKAREEKEKADKLEKERLERERLLKEKLEKERLERERLEKEKQERDKREKEAAAAAAAAAAPKIPSITVTQPSESSTPAAAPAPSGFSFTLPTAPSTTAAPAPAAPKPGGEALTAAFFAPPKTATTPTATTPSPLFVPPKTEGAAQPAASSQSPFSFKTPGAPASATTPTATTAPFSFAATTNATSKPAATSPFGQPSATPSQASATEKKPGFSFNAPATGGSVFAPNPSQPAAVSTVAAPASTAPSTAPKFNFFGGSNKASDAKPAETQQPAAATGGVFSFGKPAATAAPAAEPVKNATALNPTGTTPTSKFSFGGTPSTATTTTTPAFGSTTSTASPFGAAPSTSSSTTATAGSAFGQTPSSLSSAFGPVKPATNGASSSIFGGASTPANGAAASSTTPGKLSFGFGAPATGGDKGKSPVTPTSNKPAAAFGGFGGASTTNGAGSAFGAGAGTGSSAFGKPAESSTATGATSKQSFSFGTPAAATSSTTPTPATETPKANFSFAPSAATTTTPAGTPATGGTGGFSFAFGTKAPTAGGATGGGVFGGASAQPATPAAFGFGTPAAGSTTPAGTPAAFTFGKP
ncbi:hypothetical protein EST38_g377 [Candolleomyces aberdarensis]|uniref:Uncharacterized protein n=1 Tax=Candolleomyces aberdarensis TaxID=2316362 RepID=A0A4Q2DY67_9AGAR|nr:hypothetical protein EST38_g377 [Candolleomyces aberdarensis]